MFSLNFATYSVLFLIGWLWFSPNMHIIGLFLDGFILTSFTLFCDLISARTDTHHDSLIRAQAVFFCSLQEKSMWQCAFKCVFQESIDKMKLC